jgi:hypothetical protein
LADDVLGELLSLQRSLMKAAGYGLRTPAELGVAIASEGLELWTNEGRSGKGKWWKRPPEDLLAAQKEEAIDILHFWLQLCLALGLESHEVLLLYKLKMDENLARQKRGY